MLSSKSSQTPTTDPAASGEGTALDDGAVEPPDAPRPTSAEDPGEAGSRSAERHSAKGPSADGFSVSGNPSGSAGERPDIMLLCNPQAGGRWKELARILDSPEAKHVRWIVTDSIEDIGPALASMGRETRLLCIYGGDGTIQQVLEKLLSERHTPPTLAFIGGGTMNVVAGYCGWGRRPERNFRQVVQAYKAGELLTKEVPLLEVNQGAVSHLGFTFGLGPIVRVLNEYEQGRKGPMAALQIAARSLTDAWHRPVGRSGLLDPFQAEILQNGEPLPYRNYALLFANSTGRLHLGVRPFLKRRTRETFHFGAYAVSRQEIALFLPLIARGVLPPDPRILVQSVSGWKRVALALVGHGVFPSDPRYVNDLARTLEIRTDEPIYTVDAEMVESTGEPIRVSAGPYLQLAVHPTVDLPGTVKLAARLSVPVRPDRR